MPLLSRLAVQAARAYGMLVSGATTNVPVTYLVVAGGGSGADYGGGGAGGYQTSTATLSTLNTYSITVGAGGSGSTTGSNGSNSVLSGTGLTTITSVGGGRGANNTTPTINGSSGGSGGGGRWSGGTGGAGTSGQGNAGGNGGSVGSPDLSYPAGGGGGASAVGGNGITGGSGGAGGAGSSSSISGSSVTYAGGGGGGCFANPNGVGGAAGAGGGGIGGTSGAGAGAGTANRGGGGGGGGNTGSTGASGGSGIVIISYASASPRFVGGTITTSGGNQIHTFTSSGTLSPITPITASYLVVAGGGGGGGWVNAVNNGGGGGAGGLLTSSTTLYSGATYVVTVGAGGAGGNGTNGTQGSNSIVSGTGLTTLTSIGGGFGGKTGAGGNGGSGGGATGISGSTFSGGTGTAGQGNDGGSSNSGGFWAGGGGGAGAVGASGGTTGNGGVGLSSSISGTATFYAGGGGAGFSAASTPGAGGAGGGGSGVVNNPGVSGTPNTGGGGGGTAGSSFAGSGGSGIVIISYAGSQQFNGGLVTTSGGNTIHTFTSTGALTPLTNNLTNSLRTRGSANAYLNRTPALATNRQTFTWSGWLKRGTLGANGYVFGAEVGGSGSYLYFDSSDKLNFYDYASATFQFQLITTQVFRDPSAWYHVVIVSDTTQATAANRIRMYVNGQQITAFGTATYPSQNYNNSSINNNNVHYIGYTGSSFDGYRADVNFIDGQALEPYFFGNNDANGVWKPIQYRGTYGINGFYLNFSNTTSTTTLGFDSSPNGNNWTTNNISLTAGVTYDAMTDVPTNTSATVANYCVLNPLQRGSSITLSNANLTWSTSGSSSKVLSTIGMSSGKYYCEFTMASGNGNYGVATGRTGLSGSNYLGDDTNSWCYAIDGNKYTNGSGAAYGATYTAGDIIGVAFDADAGTLSYFKNGTSQGTAFTGLTNGPYFFAQGADPSAGSVNFGQRPFSYTPPTGFVALNTFNLPTPTILQGNRFMDATLYTGNGASSNTAVNAGQFKPDFVWIKSRVNNPSGGALNHVLTDSVRGVTKELNSNNTGAEGTNSAGLTAFNSNGFTVGGDYNYNNPGNGGAMVGWQWQAGQGSTSSNTAGSITSTVSVNATAGFSVVTYTGNGTNGASVGHGLGVKPVFWIIKQRSGTQNWLVSHQNLSATDAYLILDSTSAALTNAPNIWTADSSKITFTTSYAGTNANTSTYVMYAWAEIAGFSRFGSYVGNGAASGPFIYTGFRPKFVMIKNVGTTVAPAYGSWKIIDTSRDIFNGGNPKSLYANASYQEGLRGNGSSDAYVEQFDLLSNGFKLGDVTSGSYDVETNQSGVTYIYVAFAEHPFKNANAR